MPLTALLLVLGAAVLHAAWNIVAKRAGGGRHFSMLTSLLLLLAWSPLGLVLAWQQVPSWGLLPWVLVAASGAVHVLYFRTLLHGYRVADLTVVYPVARGTGPLVSASVAALWLHESPGLAGWAGVAGVVAGVLCIAGGPRLWAAWRPGSGPSAQPEPGPEPGAATGRPPAASTARTRAGIAWGALTGLLIAGYTLVDGYAVKWLLLSPILVDYMGNLLRVALQLPEALADPRGLWAEARVRWRPALAIALLSPVAYVLVLYAAQQAPLSRVAPAREVSMLVAALAGGQLLGEGDRAWRLAGAACMALGVVLLSL